MNIFEDAPDHLATGGESLREFAHNAGADNPDRAWLLDTRDVWVQNPCYSGPPVPHPEDDRPDFFATFPPAPAEASAAIDDDLPF